MKILKVIMGVFLFIVLAGCELINNTKSTTPIAETTNSTTTTSLTTEELSDAELWEAAITDLENVKNISVIENFDTNYKYNGQNANSKIVSQMDIMNENWIMLNLSYNIRYNSPTTQTYYIQQEQGIYYFYQLVNNKWLKYELDYSLFNRDNLIYDFTFETGMPYLTFEEEYNKDEMNYVKFTRVFKLNDLPTKYQSMFDENIKLLLGYINPSIYLNLEIKETIILNKTNRTFEEVSYDLTNVIGAVFSKSAFNSATNITSTYTIQFENRGQVNVDIKPIESAYLDDAPNDIFQTFFAYPQSYGTEPILGRSDYKDDIDLIKLHIDEANKYLFHTSQFVKMYVLSENGQELFSGQSDMNTYLEPGDYYLMVYCQSQGINYEITISNIKDDYADVIKDTEQIGIINGNITKDGKIDYPGDLDIFKLTPNETDDKYYTFTLNTNKNIKVSILLDYHTYDYTPRDGKIVFGYALHQNEDVYIQIQSDEVVNYQFEIKEYTDETDAPERIDDPNLRTIAINEPVQEATHTRSYVDDDFFKFTVVEKGYYEFNISLIIAETMDFYGEVELYDINGTLLTDKFSHELSPGDYFLKVRESSNMVYELTIKSIIDDYSTPTPLTLTEINHVISGTIDYVDDIDEIDLLINEEGYYHLALSDQNNTYFKLKIKDEYDNVIIENNKYYDSNYYYYLYPGKYHFHISGMYYMGGKDYSIAMSKNATITGDIGYNYQLNEQYLGQITVGQEQQVNFEYPYDKDVYKVTITQAGDFATYGASFYEIVDAEGNKVPFNPEDRLLSLNQGTYYLYFYNHSTLISSFSMIPIVDDYVNGQSYPLSLDTTKNGIIQFASDIDQFELTITEPGLYEYNFDATKIKMEIYDETGNLVNLQVKWDFNAIQLINQTYTIKLYIPSYYPFDNTVPYSIQFKLKTNQLDSDPDVAYLPSDMYRTLTVGEALSGKIDSTDDIDVFVVELTQGGWYNFHYEPMLWPVKIIHENGSEYTYSDRNYLHVGTNYILVTHSNLIDYKISISQ